MIEISATFSYFPYSYLFRSPLILKVIFSGAPLTFPEPGTKHLDYSLYWCGCYSMRHLVVIYFLFYSLL